MCDVCCEDFNQTFHKEVACPHCELRACRRCTEKYVLSQFDDVHCMGCKNKWNRIFTQSWASKRFCNTTLRRHREEVLFEREKSLFPETQPIVERILRHEEIQREIKKCSKEIFELYNRHQIFQIPYTRREAYLEENHPDILEKSQRLRDLYRLSSELDQPFDTTAAIPKFVRKCPNTGGNCQGFLNEEFYCGLCKNTYCNQCNELVEDGHECDPDAKASIALIRRDTKPCPKCGTFIHKLSGCTQMWCPDCHTAFNFNTGAIEMGRIHNPHYLEYRKNGGMLSREHGDIPCGGLPSFAELREMQAPDCIMRFRLTLNQLDREIQWMSRQPLGYGRCYSAQHARVQFMLGNISEAWFKKNLQKIDKQRDKNKDITDIYQMMIDTGGDALRQYAISPDTVEEIRSNINDLVDYANTVIRDIHARYTCVLPRPFDKI
jgi:hypothetical protein